MEKAKEYFKIPLGIGNKIKNEQWYIETLNDFMEILIYLENNNDTQDMYYYGKSLDIANLLDTQTKSLYYNMCILAEHEMYKLYNIIFG